jgi:hypothetical protein
MQYVTCVVAIRTITRSYPSALHHTIEELLRVLYSVVLDSLVKMGLAVTKMANGKLISCYVTVVCMMLTLYVQWF